MSIVVVHGNNGGPPPSGQVHSVLPLLNADDLTLDRCELGYLVKYKDFVFIVYFRFS